MTDHVGLLQHATLDVPNPDFGYCTDDNARALIVALHAIDQAVPSPALMPLSEQYFRFVQSAFVPAGATFRNLLSYDGTWLDEEGPGDAAGRAMWALGALVGQREGGSERTAALAMFERAVPASETWPDLRPIANAILGICAYLRHEQSQTVQLLLQRLGEQLSGKLDEWQEPDWHWPEPVMTYENARLPHALIAAGRMLNNATFLSRGLTCLAWLMTVQTSSDQFCPVGNDGWYARGGIPARFDQQPLEAEASVAACTAAYRSSHDVQWLSQAQRAFNWFVGENAAGESLRHAETGGCCDGLGPSGVNRNQGAESTLAWLSSQLTLETLIPFKPHRASKETAK